MKNNFNDYLKLVKENTNVENIDYPKVIKDIIIKFMPYPNRYDIKTVDDVKSFFHDLVYNLHLNFHPDDSFNNYINDKNEDLFTKEQAIIFDTLMSECFDICSQNDADIYEIGMEITNAYTGLDKLINADNMYHNDEPETPGITIEKNINEYFEPIIPNAVDKLKDIHNVITINDKNEFDNLVSQQKYFSASHSHCFYSKDEYETWSKTHVSSDDAVNSDIIKNCGDLVAVWDNKNKIGYVLPNIVDRRNKFGQTDSIVANSSDKKTFESYLKIVKENNELDNSAFILRYDDIVKKLELLLEPKGIEISRLEKENTFVSGTKNWNILWAIYNGVKYSIGDVIKWDKEGFIKGRINWMIVTEEGKVEVSINHKSVGRLPIEEISKPDTRTKQQKMAPGITMENKKFNDYLKLVKEEYNMMGGVIPPFNKWIKKGNTYNITFPTDKNKKYTIPEHKIDWFKENIGKQVKFKTEKGSTKILLPDLMKENNNYDLNSEQLYQIIIDQQKVDVMYDILFACDIDSEQYADSPSQPTDNEIIHAFTFYKSNIISNFDLKNTAYNTAKTLIKENIDNTDELYKIQFLKDLDIIYDHTFDFSNVGDMAEIQDEMATLYKNVLGKELNVEYDNGWQVFKKVWKEILDGAKLLDVTQMKKIREEHCFDDFLKDVVSEKKTNKKNMIKEEKKNFNGHNIEIDVTKNTDNSYTIEVNCDPEQRYAFEDTESLLNALYYGIGEFDEMDKGLRRLYPEVKSWLNNIVIKESNNYYDLESKLLEEDTIKGLDYTDYNLDSDTKQTSSGFQKLEWIEFLISSEKKAEIEENIESLDSWFEDFCKTNGFEYHSVSTADDYDMVSFTICVDNDEPDERNVRPGQNVDNHDPYLQDLGYEENEKMVTTLAEFKKLNELFGLSKKEKDIVQLKKDIEQAKNEIDKLDMSALFRQSEDGGNDRMIYLRNIIVANLKERIPTFLKLFPEILNNIRPTGTNASHARYNFDTNTVLQGITLSSLSSFLTPLNTDNIDKVKSKENMKKRLDILFNDTMEKINKGTYNN